MIVDESFGTTGQGYRLTRIHHLGEHTVRVDIRYDSYAHQSHATADVLSTGQTWTTLVSDPPSNWHDAAPSPYARPAPTAEALYVGRHPGCRYRGQVSALSVLMGVG